MSRMRSRKASEARPRSPTTQPGTSAGSRADPAPRATRGLGRARARRRSPGRGRRRSRRPSSRSRRESGQAPRAGLAPGDRIPLFRPRRLLVGADARAVEGGHAQRDPAPLRQLVQALPEAPLGPAGEQRRGQPPRAKFGRDAAPLGPVLVPPENRRDGPPQLLGRCLAAGPHLFDQRLPGRPRRVGEDLAPVPIRHAPRSEEHTSELQSRQYLVCRLLLEKKKKYLCDTFYTFILRHYLLV